MEIKNVLIVGTGTLGSQIGFQCAMHGFRTTMYDTQTGALEACEQRHQRIGEKVIAQIGKGKLGVNSGEGFYNYPDPTFLQEDFLT